MPTDDPSVEYGEARPRPGPDRESAVNPRSQRTRSEVKKARGEGRKTLFWIGITALVSNFTVDLARGLIEWAKELWAHFHMTIRIWWT